ncbi:MAG TPA: hypothetical protein VF533_21915 [Solirubrobacteraceae bacterium]
MDVTRRERLAFNEAAFRVANERMRGWEERHAAGGRERYYCECSDRRCRTPLLLTQEEYDAVRAHPERFVIVAGHATEEVERVLEVRGATAIVEKTADAARIARRTDPRGD